MSGLYLDIKYLTLQEKPFQPAPPTFHLHWTMVLQYYPDKLSLYLVHYPLQIQQKSKPLLQDTKSYNNYFHLTAEVLVTWLRIKSQVATQPTPAIVRNHYEYAMSISDIAFKLINPDSRYSKNLYTTTLSPLNSITEI